MKVTITVNGRDVAAEVEDRALLVHFLRDAGGLTATNVGCDTTSCGACTVLLDGESVKSCTVLAAQAEGSAVTTLEGLAQLDPEGGFVPDRGFASIGYGRPARTARCTRSSAPSITSTGCSAGSAPPAW